MTPNEVYNAVRRGYPDAEVTTLCNLHSACSPRCKKVYMCGSCQSNYPNLDFDKVKEDYVRREGLPSCSSVDALAPSPSDRSLCFTELKSWEMVYQYSATERKRINMINRKASEYKSDIPKKLTDSIEICKNAAGGSLHGISLHLILVTDIDTTAGSEKALASNLNLLAGTAVKQTSDWRDLCNTLSNGILNGITDVTTHYWRCTDFDAKIAKL